jgi:hypothetical protein
MHCAGQEFKAVSYRKVMWEKEVASAMRSFEKRICSAGFGVPSFYSDWCCGSFQGSFKFAPNFRSKACKRFVRT